jgi:hypothetical protein
MRFTGYGSFQRSPIFFIIRRKWFAHAKVSEFGEADSPGKKSYAPRSTNTAFASNALKISFQSRAVSFGVLM